MSNDVRVGADASVALPQPAATPAWWSLSKLSNHFPALHGLRVLAVVSVVQVHVTGGLQKNGIALEPGAALASLQVWYGMDCFFILSGFLIGSLLVRDRTGIAPRRLGRFYMRRSFRIFPLYYVVLTATALFVGLAPGQWRTLIFEYLYLTNYMGLDRPAVMNYAWSLAVEEHFYLAAPFLVAFVGLARSVPSRYALLFILWIAPAIARWVTYPYVDDTPGSILASLYVWTHTRADILVAGIFIAFVQRDYSDQIAALLRKRSVRVAGALIVFASLIFIHFGLLFGIGFRASVTLAFGTVTSIMYVVMVLWLLNYRGMIARFFSRPLFLDVATLGYGIYLLHVPVIEVLVVPWSKWIVGQGVSVGAAWCGALALTMLLSAFGAYCLHLLVDKPMLRLRQRLTP